MDRVCAADGVPLVDGVSVRVGDIVLVLLPVSERVPVDVRVRVDEGVPDCVWLDDTVSVGVREDVPVELFDSTGGLLGVSFLVGLVEADCD